MVDNLFIWCENAVDLREQVEIFTSGTLCRGFSAFSLYTGYPSFFRSKSTGENEQLFHRNPVISRGDELIHL